MKAKSFTYSFDDIDKIVDYIVDLLGSYQVFTFNGPLGVGKTTLIKKILAKCGVKDLIVSPTFTYVAEYSNDKGEVFYHFDLYRIKSLDEFYNAGFHEFLYIEGTWAFIEWPEVIMPILQKKVCNIDLEYVDELTRKANLTYID